MTAYLYADDGRARWLVAGGPNADPYHYTGRLLEVGGGQTLFGAYVTPTTQADAGPVSVDFSDDTLRRLHVRRHRKSGVVFLRGSDDLGNHVLRRVAAVLQWSDAHRSVPPARHSGERRIADARVHRPGCACAQFTSAVAGVDDAQAKAGASRSMNISREFRPVPHPYDFPNSFTGSFAQSLELHTTQGPLEVTITSLAIGTGITWVNTGQHPRAPAGDQVTGQLTRYVPAAGGKVVVALNYEAEASGASCTGNAAQTFAFKDLESALLISTLPNTSCRSAWRAMT